MPIHTEVVEYLTNTTDLKAVADAIRAKGGTSGVLVYPDGFVSAINAITTGGGSDDVLNSIIDRSIAGKYENNTVESIGNYAFYQCEKLTTIIIGAVKSIGVEAFENCFNLTTVNAPEATSMGNTAFYCCYRLSTIFAPKTTTIGSNAFAACENLQKAEFPVLKTIGGRAFSNTGLKNVNYPLITSIPYAAFERCDSLIKADFTNVTSIGSSAFYKATVLETVILRGSNVATLASPAFSETPIANGTGYIYVPSTLVAAYKDATNWATYADQIRAIEDYPSITGG